LLAVTVTIKTVRIYALVALISLKYGVIGGGWYRGGG